MSAHLLFGGAAQSGGAAAARSDATVIASFAVSKAAVAGSPAAPQPVEPFDVSAEQWRGVKELVGRLRGFEPDLPYDPFPNLAREIEGYAGEFRTHDHFGPILPLLNSWIALKETSSQWETATLPGLVAVAEGIRAYDAEVVPLYKELQEILEPLEDRKPTADDHAKFVNVTGSLRGRAKSCAEAADRSLAAVRGFVDHVENFRRDINNTPLPQAPQIMSRLGLSVRPRPDRHLEAASPNRSDPLQVWRVFPSGQGRAFLVSLNGVEHAITAQPGSGWGAAVEPFNRDRRQFWGVGSADGMPDEAMISGYNVGCTLDVSGNSGWGPGTDILYFERNGGPNQRWYLEPPQMDGGAHIVYLCATRLMANVTPSRINDLQHIRGDWEAVEQDLATGLEHIEKDFDLGQPFASELNADAAISAWGRIAKEAEALLANVRQ